jgi:hypothetical protein
MSMPYTTLRPRRAAGKPAASALGAAVLPLDTAMPRAVQ